MRKLKDDSSQDGVGKWSRCSPAPFVVSQEGRDSSSAVSSRCGLPFCCRRIAASRHGKAATGLRGISELKSNAISRRLGVMPVNSLRRLAASAFLYSVEDASNHFHGCKRIGKKLAALTASLD